MYVARLPPVVNRYIRIVVELGQQPLPRRLRFLATRSASPKPRRRGQEAWGLGYLI
jgi:hypothetical protein